MILSFSLLFYITLQSYQPSHVSLKHLNKCESSLLLKQKSNCQSLTALAARRSVYWYVIALEESKGPHLDFQSKHVAC